MSTIDLQSNKAFGQTFQRKLPLDRKTPSAGGSSSRLLLVLGASLLAASCSDYSSNETLKSYSRADLKRYSEEEFTSVTRRVYYAGATLPILKLPRDGERGILTLKNGETTEDVRKAQILASRLRLKFSIPATVGIADAATRDVLRFYREQFGRNSYDGNGADINFAVDANRDLKIFESLGENAAWATKQNPFIFFGAGGEHFKSLIMAVDVVGHEFTHAVIESSSNLEYKGQSGALNEHFADVFGELYQAYVEEREPSFLMGETITIGPLPPLRDFLNPELGLSKQPGKVSDIPDTFGEKCTTPSPQNDQCGVHILSGIPNRFAANVIKRLKWLKVRDMFYTVMTEKLTSTGNFADYAREMRSYAGEHFSFADAQIVDEALVLVGL
jgi:Zn-dependent metalloprotease